MRSLLAYRSALVAALITLTMVSGATAQYRRRTSSSVNGIPGVDKDPAATMHGVLKRIKGKELLLTTDENQDIVVYLTHKTKYLSHDGHDIRSSSIVPGSIVSVDVSKAPDMSSLAVNVRVEAPPV